jgi:hypothetical protein
MATECELMAWIVDKTIIPPYIDTAKSFATLSSGALGLTIVFYEKIVGAKPWERSEPNDGHFLALLPVDDSIERKLPVLRCTIP